MSERLKVVHILSRGRSGSTILDLTLGTLDGFFSGGELRRFWEFGLERGQPCACGEAVWECPVWGPVLQGLPELKQFGLENILGCHKEIFSSSAVPRLLCGAGWPWAGLQSYRNVAVGTYRGLARTTGASVIVDSSKRAVHPAVLGLLADMEVYAVHLVRDPRAVTFSEQRRLKRLRVEEPLFFSFRQAAAWTVYNLLIESVVRRYLPGRWMRIRYEDFVARPGSTVERITRLVGSTQPLTVSDGTIQIQDNHVVAGNRARHSRGEVQLREDSIWRDRMRLRDRRVVAGVTWPLLRRFGYL